MNASSVGSKLVLYSPSATGFGRLASHPGTIRAALQSIGLHIVLIGMVWLMWSSSGRSSSASAAPVGITVSLVTDYTGELNAATAASADPAGRVGQESQPVGSEVTATSTGSDGRRTIGTPPDSKSSPVDKAADGLPTPGATEQAQGGQADRAVPGQSAEPGEDPLLEAKYIAAMRANVFGRWDNAGAPIGVACTVRVEQLLGGTVSVVTFVDCPFDHALREAIESSLKATPLPYSGFESLFDLHRTEEIVYCRPPGC